MGNPIALEAQELSVRKKPSGGGVDAVQIGPDGGASGHGRIILLLHGYANSLTRARDSYKEFEKNFGEKQPEHAAANLPHTFRFYWPGDAHLPSPVHYLSYPTEITPAKESAEMLEKYLRGLAPPPIGVIEVFLIAHSLGNRVVLELLNRFTRGRRTAKLQFKGICMMAAAVPVAKVRWGSKLYFASTLADQRFMLYSRSDMVLMLLFALGEIAAFDATPWPWDWPEAIGRNGNPPQNWTYHQEMRKKKDDKGYGHGDYWSGEEIPEHLADFLRIPRDRQVATSSIATNEIATSAGPPTAAPQARDLLSRAPLG